MLRELLLPVDFSTSSAQVVKYAYYLAHRERCCVTVVHVVPPGDHYLENEFSASAARDLDHYAQRHLRGLPVRTLVLRGDPAREIVNQAHQSGVDLIIMATHGYGPFRRWLLGSVTAKVLHDAHCPVWTGVHRDEWVTSDPIAIRRILCAVDLGPQSREVFRWASALAGRLKSELLLLNIVPSFEMNLGFDYCDAGWPERIRASVRDRLHELQAEVGTGAEILIGSGKPPEAISRIAQENRADLVVIGRGCGPAFSGRLRPQAYAIIRESFCPVVAV